jgi:urate oxidase
MSNILFDTYGKTKVRLTYVQRLDTRHEIKELSVDIFLEGAFQEAFTNADNSIVLPTDTMKNTVYALARKNGIKSIEEFAADLSRHFLAGVPHLSHTRIAIKEVPWSRIGDSPAAFTQAGLERRAVSFIATRSAETVRSGIQDLQILKTTDSAFTGFIKDQFTTLPETTDRLLGTVLQADWLYAGKPYANKDIDFNQTHSAIRSRLLSTFAAHKSLSVQQTLYDMAEAVLNQFSSVSEIHLVMPNKHCLLVDLSKFGMDNPNQVFYPIDEPCGYIEAVVSR